ncbi:Uncharacterised protein [[Eubacterium] contortum]|uniref:Uncharacterized protein n=1 Tax=Faecalicatena contorta TaxID=39482 RepID=A0A174BUT3_9FIRM|nr:MULTISPECIES: hypothetical protein [Clostridia]CUO03919.1 Uncharacterised protein [[Eubacterium] contortum] [Faecalicatena contorta]
MYIEKGLEKITSSISPKELLDEAGSDSEKLQFEQLLKLFDEVLE